MARQENDNEEKVVFQNLITKKVNKDVKKSELKNKIKSTLLEFYS